MSDGITIAPDIKGHEGIVEWFIKHRDQIDNLPEQYVIANDSYYANYKSHHKEGSKINQAINEEYIPRVGGLVEADKVGRDEPDVFYKMLVKDTSNFSSAFHGNTHDISCEMLFVRTDQKQLYKRVFKLELKVQSEVYDLFHFLGRDKPEPEKQTNAKLFVMASKNLSYQPQHSFRLAKVKREAIRVSQKKYDHEQRKKLATPRWANHFKINAIYLERSRLNARDGKNSWHVDHIFPLKYRGKHGEEGSGLHIHQNLEIVSREQNLKKSNRFVGEAGLQKTGSNISGA